MSRGGHFHIPDLWWAFNSWSFPCLGASARREQRHRKEGANNRRLSCRRKSIPCAHVHEGFSDRGSSAPSSCSHFPPYLPSFLPSRPDIVPVPFTSNRRSLAVCITIRGSRNGPTVRRCRYLGTHPNIVSLEDLFVNEQLDELYVVMELLDTDLHSIIQSPQALGDVHHRYFMFQLLKGVKVCRRRQRKVGKALRHLPVGVFLAPAA